MNANAPINVSRRGTLGGSWGLAGNLTGKFGPKVGHLTNDQLNVSYVHCVNMLHFSLC